MEDSEAVVNENDGNTSSDSGSNGKPGKVAKRVTFNDTPTEIPPPPMHEGNPVVECLKTCFGCCFCEDGMYLLEKDL